MELETARQNFKRRQGRIAAVLTACLPSIKALRKTAAEFETYIANNKDMIPNYAERRRYGERVSTGFVESTVNTVVGKRFGKKQQMR